MAEITLCIGPCRVTYYGNRALKVRVFGFIGGVYVDVPFLTHRDAMAFVADHGWTVRPVADYVPEGGALCS